MGSELKGWRRARVVAALIGAAFGFVMVVLAVLPGAPYLPDGLEFIPFVMIFPLFGWAVIERALEQSAGRKGQPRQKWYEQGMSSNAEASRAWNDMWVQVRRYWIVVAIGIPLLVVMWILMGYSIVSIQGQPEHIGNRYFLNDHGSEIPVTQAGYENAVAKQELIFAGAGTMFLVVSAGLTLTFDPTRTVGRGMA